LTEIESKLSKSASSLASKFECTTTVTEVKG